MSDLIPLLSRIADALDRLAPPSVTSANLGKASAYRWDGQNHILIPVVDIFSLPLDLLKGIPDQKQKIYENSWRFSNGLPANNVLLWGARGMGKSSLVKSIHAHLLKNDGKDLALVEIHKDEIETLSHLMRQLSHSSRRFLLFCDDLSFGEGDNRYKALKAALEGGLEGRPRNCLLYATSNQRHLLPRNIVENETETAINPRDVLEDKVSLSDRFGLWIGFHTCTQDEYLDMIASYVDHYHLPIAQDEWLPRALKWSRTRGARSGRVAWQFIQDIAGEKGVCLD